MSLCVSLFKAACECVMVCVSVWWYIFLFVWCVSVFNGVSVFDGAPQCLVYQCLCCVSMFDVLV